MKKFVFTFVNIVFTLVLSMAGITQLYAADEPAAKSELEAQEEVKTTDVVEPVATAATVAATPSGIESLRALVDEASYKEAYAQSQEMLFDFEGEPEFDLLYGTAALGVGESTESILIFERLVASDPTNLRYQLDLGRSYYQAGQKEKAKSTFESILVSDQEVPENIEVQALSYLDAIVAGSKFGNPEKAETLKGFIGLAGGYDSNANSASSADFIFPVFFPSDGGDPFTIQTNNGTSEESTGYLSYQFGGAYAKPLGDRSVLDFKVAAQQRKNSSDLDYADNGATFIELANRWRLEKGIAMISARYTGVTFGGEDLYDYVQLGLNWSQPVAWQFADSLNLSLTSGSISYSSDLNETRDIDPTILGLGVNKQVEQFVHGVSLNYGMDDSAGEQVIQNIAYKADWYSRNYWVLGYNLSYLYDSKTTLFGGLSYQSSSYEEEDPNFADGSGPTPDYDKRDGIQTTFVVGAGYALNESLNFKGTISVMDAASDIDLYEYSRNKLEVGASYQL